MHPTLCSYCHKIVLQLEEKQIPYVIEKVGWQQHTLHRACSTAHGRDARCVNSRSQAGGIHPVEWCEGPPAAHCSSEPACRTSTTCTTHSRPVIDTAISNAD